MKNERGFTLLELLLVLFIAMCLTGIVTKISLKAAEAKELEQFFSQLELDIQFVQMYIMQERQPLFLKFEASKNHYMIKQDFFTNLYERPFPKDVEFLPVPSTFITITYNTKGNVSQAGTLYFKTPQGIKKVVITLGVGRVRIE